VLRVKLARLEAGNAARERLAGRYDEALAGVGDLVPPARVEGRTSARHLHVVRTRHREELLATEAWAAECLSLPLYPELTDTQQDRVIEVVRGFFATR
jgi:dTDP-4-amino-4,6-dideoxygalactose transaminase